MKRERFLRELEDLLSDIPADERAEAVGYYRDYFEEAGVRPEDEVPPQTVSPRRAAAEIRGGLSGGDAGEFTERGYQDGRSREEYHVPDQYAGIAVSGSGGRSREDGADAREEAQDRKDSGESFWSSFAREGKSCREEWSKWRQERERRFERDRGRNGGAGKSGSGREGPRWWEYKGPKGRQYDDAYTYDTRAERAAGAGQKQYDNAYTYETRRREDGSYRQGRRRADDRSGRIAMLVLLAVCFGFPVAGTLIGAGFSVAGGILGGIFGIFCGVFGLIIAAFTAAVTAFGGGIGLIGAGFARQTVEPAVGLMMTGGGFFLLAFSMLLLLIVRWGCASALPWMFRLTRDIFRKIAECFRGAARRIFGHRGDRV